jgi:hypothetical protein
VFCEDCLTKSVAGTEIVCPIDKLSHSIGVEALPVCFAILTNLPRERSREVTCARHPRKKVKFLCKTHDKFLCSDCIIEHTGTGHTVIAYSLQSVQMRHDLEELEHRFTKKSRTIQEAVRTLESFESKVKPFYEAQAAKVNAAFDVAVKVLTAKRKELLVVLQKHSCDQLKQLEAVRASAVKMCSVASSGSASVTKFKEELTSHNYEEVFSFLQGMSREADRINEAVSPPDLQFWAFKSSLNSDDVKSIELGSIAKVDDKPNENEFWMCQHCLKANSNVAKHCYFCRKRKATINCSPSSTKDLASPANSSITTARGREARLQSKTEMELGDYCKQPRPASPKRVKLTVRKNSRHKRKNSF